MAFKIIRNDIIYHYNGWGFLFLGANIDAIEVAGMFGAALANDWKVKIEADYKKRHRR